MSIRSERIAEQIRSELDSVLRQETSDPRVGLLTLTHVKLSSDLSAAVVFWSPLATESVDDLDEIAEGLESALGFLRGRLAKRLSLRRMPTLSFRYDPSLRDGSDTLAILRGLPEVRAADVQENESGDDGD